jgi:hypothetical protein
LAEAAMPGDIRHDERQVAVFRFAGDIDAVEGVVDERVRFVGRLLDDAALNVWTLLIFYMFSVLFRKQLEFGL